MSVFDDMDRPTTDAHPHGEPDFVYTNRSGRDVAARVRGLIEEYISRYPEADRPALIQRLRSSIDSAHRSAFLELLLHELFSKRGHKVIEVEPAVPGTTKNPDFLMETAKGERFYLEVVLATGKSADEVAAEKRLNAAIQAIDSTPSPDHFLDLRPVKAPNTPVPINKLQRELRKWIAALPEGDASKTAAPFRFKHDGMEIVLTAWPKHNKGSTGRAIGARHFGAGNVLNASGMKEAVDFKGRKYGKALPHPLVVAVAGYENFSYDDDALDALLGTEIVQVSKDAEGKSVTALDRKLDGVWRGKDGPRRTVLSGVIWCKQIDPWNFAARTPLVLANPWADRPMPRLDLGLHEMHISTQAVSDYPGDTLGKALELPDYWPED